MQAHIPVTQLNRDMQVRD